MSGLFDIIQYEVQAFEDGHWQVRARYPRSDRDHAFTEARRLDLNEGLPSRVVRDVYEPQSGRSQEFTIFMSDRMKALKPRRAAPHMKGERSAQKSAHARRNERPAPFAFRATMALGVGMVTALLVSAIATWALAPQPESFASVLGRSPASGSPMTLFVAVMLFSVFAMLRGPLGISRLARQLGAHLTGEMGRPAEMPTPVQRRFIAPPPTIDLPPAPPDQDNHVLSLSRVMLARFFAEAAPSNAAKALEDALGRRGLALCLAGAACELAAHLEMPSPADLMAQITPLTLRDSTAEMIAEARALGAADTALMAAGRTSMRSYVSAADERPSMAAALVAWHKAVRAETAKHGAKGL